MRIISFSSWSEIAIWFNKVVLILGCWQGWVCDWQRDQNQHRGQSSSRGAWSAAREQSSSRGAWSAARQGNIRLRSKDPSRERSYSDGGWVRLASRDTSTRLLRAACSQRHEHSSCATCVRQHWLCVQTFAKRIIQTFHPALASELGWLINYLM